MELLFLNSDGFQCYGIFRESGRIRVFKITGNEAADCGQVDMDAIGGCVIKDKCLIFSPDGHAALVAESGIVGFEIPREMYAVGYLGQETLLFGGGNGRLTILDSSTMHVSEDKLAHHPISKPGRNVHGIRRFDGNMYILGKNSLLVQNQNERWLELASPGKSSERQYTLFYAAKLKERLFVSGLYGTEPFCGEIVSHEIRIISLPSICQLDSAPVISAYCESLVLLADSVWMFKEGVWVESDPKKDTACVDLCALNNHLLVGKYNGALRIFDGKKWRDLAIRGWPQ